MESSHGEVKTQERDRPATSLLCLRLTSRQTRSIDLVFIVGAIVPVCTPLIWSKRRMNWQGTLPNGTWERMVLKHHTSRVPRQGHRCVS